MTVKKTKNIYLIDSHSTFHALCVMHYNNFAISPHNYILSLILV